MDAPKIAEILSNPFHIEIPDYFLPLSFQGKTHKLKLHCMPRNIRIRFYNVTKNKNFVKLKPDFLILKGKEPSVLKLFTKVGCFQRNCTRIPGGYIAFCFAQKCIEQKSSLNSECEIQRFFVCAVNLLAINTVHFRKNFPPWITFFSDLNGSKVLYEFQSRSSKLLTLENVFGMELNQ